MFRILLDTPLKTLSLGARQHALLASTGATEIRTALERDDWTCHVCGTRLEEMMEADHLKGHRKSPAESIAPICQFCHDLKHPVWAASRKRLVPIDAPDISQEELSRLSWAALIDGGAAIERTPLLVALDDRYEGACELLGGDNLEGVIEAFFAHRDAAGDAAARAVADRLDARIRFVPAALREETGVMRWTRKGFRPVPAEALRAALPGADPDGETLRAAARSLTPAN